MSRFEPKLRLHDCTFTLDVGGLKNVNFQAVNQKTVGSGTTTTTKGGKDGAHEDDDQDQDMDDQGKILIFGRFINMLNRVSRLSSKLINIRWIRTSSKPYTQKNFCIKSSFLRIYKMNNHNQFC